MALSLFGERPHAAAMPANPVSVFAAWFAKARAARARRIALAALLELDHCRLNDLGINRQDVLDAMRAKGIGFGNRLNAARAANARL